MIWIYDLEVYPNILTAVFERDDSSDVKVFIMDKNCDELIEWYNKEKPWLVGFNSVKYDDIILSRMLENDPIRKIYELSKKIISDERISVKRTVNSLDLSLINNYDNANKRTSLKWVSFTMREENLADLPADPDKPLPKGKIDDLVKYNKIDVKHTSAFYNMCKPLIKLRGELSRKYNNNDFLNFSEPKIGKEILLREMAETSGIGISELSKGRTYYKKINLEECISDKIVFRSLEFQSALDFFKEKVVDTLEGDEIILKGSCDYTVEYQGIKYEYGVGGIHGAASPQVFESCNKRVIIDSDFSSYYPLLAVTQGIRPNHLGVYFEKTYKDIYNKRKQYPKGSIENYMYKIVLNSVFGQMKSAYTPFYDPKAFLQITINGQFFLSMLIEAFSKYGEIIQANTDGLTFLTDRSNIPKIQSITKRFEDYTGLTLESGEYSKFILKDVNNYIAVDTKGGIKRKGMFETYQDIYDSIAMHKNPSATVIPSALCAYFLEGIEPGDYIYNEKNIQEFLFGIKKQRNFEYVLWNVDDDRNTSPNKLPYRVLRYYISKKGGNLYKHFNDLRITGVNKGEKIVALMNTKNKKIENLDIDYDYYINKVKEIINEIPH
jgi:hypothetical protein